MDLPRRSPSRSPRSPRSRFTFGLLLLTAVSLLVLDLPGTGPLQPVRNGLATVFSPVRAAGEAIFRPLGNGWRGAFNYGEVKDENDRLREELAERENQADIIEDLEAQIAELEALNKLEHDTVPSVAARVTRGPSSNFDRTVQINVGSDKDIGEGMAVVASGGLLGKIVDVRGGSSSVELLTEPSVAVGVRTTRGAHGVVEGQGQGDPLSFRFVGTLEGDALPELKEGAALFTSGIEESPYPGGILVARISSVQERGDGTVVYEARPAVDLSAALVRVMLKAAG